MKDWFTVDEIDSEKPVSDKQNRRRTANQPISGGLANESETAKKKEQPIRTQIANEKEVIGKSEREDGGESKKLCKQEKQTIKDIITSISE